MADEDTPTPDAEPTPDAGAPEGADAEDPGSEPGSDAGADTGASPMSKEDEAAMEAAMAAMAMINQDGGEGAAAAIASAGAAGADAEGAGDGARVGLSGPKAQGDPAEFAMPALGAPAAIEAMAPETLEMLRDVDLGVTIELGRTSMYVEDVLRMTEGSVVELDKLAGDPVDIYVNGRQVARGEILVLNDNFCVRVSEIIAPVDEQDRRAS